MPKKPCVEPFGKTRGKPLRNGERRRDCPPIRFAHSVKVAIWKESRGSVEKKILALRRATHKKSLEYRDVYRLFRQAPRFRAAAKIQLKPKTCTPLPQMI